MDSSRIGFLTLDPTQNQCGGSNRWNIFTVSTISFIPNGECYNNHNAVLNSLWTSTSSSWVISWDEITHERCEINCQGFNYWAIANGPLGIVYTVTVEIQFPTFPYKLRPINATKVAVVIWLRTSAVDLLDGAFLLYQLYHSLQTVSVTPTITPSWTLFGQVQYLHGCNTGTKLRTEDAK